MSTNFPGSADDGTTLPNPGANAPTNNPSLSAGQTNQNDAIKAIEAKIGTGASTPVTGRVFRGTGTGTSAWAQLVLTTDVTGTLPVANGGTGVTTLTIPASAILVGTTDAQDVTNKTLHDTFMGNAFLATTATVRDIVLDASKDFLSVEQLEIGAGFSLEVPATSTEEVTAFGNRVGMMKIHSFTASGTYTPSPGLLFAVIECWGAGGGGGNAIATALYNLYASGGGSGGYSKTIVRPPQIGVSQPVTVGAGGAGLASGSTTLQNTVFGGNTSVGKLCLANGGSNGGYVQGGLQVSGIGVGGLVAGAIGDIKAGGVNGLPGFYSGSKGQDTQYIGGGGGGTSLGGAGVGVVNAVGGDATANTGSGGAGGSSYAASPSAAGGAGASGIVIITEYCSA